MSDVRLRKPTARTCERCGRREVWSAESWRLDTDDDGEPVTGSIYCIHEWDINGTFLPFDDADVADV